MNRTRLTLLQAVGLNMSMMVGIGPFITIPEFVAAVGGPHAMAAWVLGALVALADGLVWSELASAFPGSGGTYHFYDAVYGGSKAGRILKFLFVWQFLFSAPLEVATGAIGLARYVGYLAPGLKRQAWGWDLSAFGGGRFRGSIRFEQVAAMGVMAAITAMAYRRIEVAGRLMVVLWGGMLATVAVVIVAGLGHFDPRIAFDFPADAFVPSPRLAIGMGAALAIAMYDFLGYYQVCYLGDEVEDASRTIPRSILISVIAVAALYLAMNLGILGVLPWRAVAASKHIASDLMQRLFGAGAARLFTLMIIWTAASSTFAALLGYSRVPYAAARSGHFFGGLARLHPTGGFPDRSLLLISGLATLACLADLSTVIAALLTSRILIQFVGQIATVFYIRSRPDLSSRLKFRMPFFPIPAVVALAGWAYVFATSGIHVIAYGLATLLLGLGVSLLRDRRLARGELDA